MTEFNVIQDACWAKAEDRYLHEEVYNFMEDNAQAAYLQLRGSILAKDVGIFISHVSNEFPISEVEEALATLIIDALDIAQTLDVDLVPTIEGLTRHDKT
jgi:hypothetical protein